MTELTALSENKSVLTDADHIYAKAYDLYNDTEWPLDTWGAVHLAGSLWSSGRLTDDDRRSLVGDLARRGLTHAEIADTFSIDQAAVAGYLEWVT